MEPTAIVLLVVVVLLLVGLAAAGVVLARKRRSEQLQEHYGPEYDRTLAETGDPQEAEALLREREQRHDELDVRELDPAERERFTASWSEVQRDFVDDPVGAVRRADALVVDIMRTRGYPVDDADRRTEDVSVAHPGVVQQYREARAVREATENGPVDTEEQRHAVTSYRALVEALLGQAATADSTTNGRHVPTREEHTR